MNIVNNPYVKKKRKRPIEHGNERRSFASTSNYQAKRNDADKRDYNERTKASGVGSGTLSAQASALIISATDKAGMEGIDRPKIDEIILRESGNSLFIQQQRRRDEKVNERVRQLQKQLGDASPRDYRVTEELDQMLRSYQQQQPMRATCVVVDMVCF